MASSIWRPSQVGTSGGEEISIHNFEELAALHAVAKILAQPEELRDQIELALQEMSDRLGMQRGMTSLIDRETGEAWLDVAHGVDIQGLDVTYLPGEGITGKVAQTGRPMAFANLGKEVHFLDRTGARRFLNRVELSFLCVPIIYDARVVGVLSADKVARQVENLERELITNALRETKGNQTQAAKLLGTTKRIIQYRIQKMGIDPWPYRKKTTDAPSSGMKED